jgi:hypothetical protein
MEIALCVDGSLVDASSGFRPVRCGWHLPFRNTRVCSPISGKCCLISGMPGMTDPGDGASATGSDEEDSDEGRKCQRSRDEKAGGRMNTQEEGGRRALRRL